jgi:endo-1,4-beta-xylanase
MVGAVASTSDAQPLAAGRSKFVGSSVGTIRTDFSKYWNQVTPENAGKWGSVEGSPGSFNWTPLDAIFNYAISIPFPYKHHNLVWGAQQPGWITGLDSAGQRAAVEDWIHQVGDRYVSMSFIDVVNEPFHSPPPYMNALGGTGTTGWDWIITASAMARKYCAHGVKLLVNEYNILQDNSVTTNYIRLIDTLRARNLIDGIGIQGHYFEFRSPAGAVPSYSYPVSTLKANLERLTATGLPVYISEFDINEANDSTQLQSYMTYFPLFWEEPGVKGITLWGYVQNDIWQTNAYLIRADGSERPALRWLRKYLRIPFPPDLVSPSGTTDVPRNPTLVWRFSSTATSYHVQLAANSRFSTFIVDTSVTDTLLHLSPLASNTQFYWHASAVNDSGASSYSLTADFTTGDQIEAVHDADELPPAFALYQNYPNPFNPATVIRYAIRGARGWGLGTSYVRLVVFDLLGREVAVLVNELKQPGTYTVTWDAGGVASGVYFYRLQAGSFVDVKEMLLVH